MNEIMVSISCATYNHENYIRDAIEGFLMQKTDFKFEIIIHDDASTDRTVEIIKDYQKRYPEIIKPIYQTENQFSKGVRIGKIIYGHAKGKYIASCEGDDYWTDPHKLQKQVDFMEANPDYSMCGHATKVIDVTTNEEIKWIYNRQGQDMELPFEYLGENLLFFQTATMVMRSEYIKNGLPEFHSMSLNGDIAIQYLMAHHGKVYYFDDVMAVHRKFAPDSYTVKYNRDILLRIRNRENQIAMLKAFNTYSKGQHNDTVQKKIENLNESLEKMKNSSVLKHMDKVIDILSPESFAKIKGNDIYIFAASVEGRRLLRVLDKYDINIKGFIDNNVNLQKKFIDKKFVYSLNEIEKNALIIVSSTFYMDEIVAQLEELQFTNYLLLKS